LMLGMVRISCEEAIPVCNQICGKALECGHICSSHCHHGECPPCSASIEGPCLCGRSARLRVSCVSLQADVDGSKRPKCARVCTIKLSCGRHRCDEICCTKARQDHICDRTCGKTLTCKKHKCLMPCGHDGNCHTCVEGVSFDELACSCGRTVMYPPIPCNTPLPKCKYSCRKRRRCGHPSYTTHPCHPDDEPCPPCTVFTEREW
jgi:transcriptional repressor NF-X1